MKKNSGIILRNYYPYKQKISIFDKEHGRVEAIIANTSPTLLHQLNNGTLLHYDITLATPCKIRELEIILIPFNLACYDLLFFHHILELCYYFLPPHCAAPHTFDLIVYLFNAATNTLNKQLILFRFFVSLGMYPENIPFENNYFKYLASQQLDVFFKEKLDDTHHKVLESWLLQCIAMHPYKDQLKTVPYNKNIMVYDEKK